MMLAPPPPTQFRELTGPVAERITTLWRIAVVATFTRAEWQDLERDASDAASRAAAEAVADVLAEWQDNGQ